MKTFAKRGATPQKGGDRIMTTNRSEGTRDSHELPHRTVQVITSASAQRADSSLLKYRTVT
ncbi:hypothetical protein SSCG_01715 [Streptomyces clavuligerus]|nr:hypothetical protein SSCG_01715 [Streptomyces clavuligerus]